MSLSNASSRLFSPVALSTSISLAHRIVLAPLTRYRSTKNEHVPHADLMTEYYGQRASAKGTLLITEATAIAQKAGGYEHIPGIWSQDQIREWKKVTDAVHAKGSYIYLQLWALGRTANPKTLQLEGNHDVVSASNIPHPDGAVPRPLSKPEITEYVSLFAQAAQNAVEGAGFDGVEIHSANGYLPDQFIQDVSNHRTEEYGGSIENRARFVLEIIEAVTKRVGPERVGIRFSPWSAFQGMKMANPVPQFSYIISHLAANYPSLSYIHLVESRATGAEGDVTLPEESLDFARAIWKKTGRPFLSAGGFTPANALDHFSRNDTATSNDVDLKENELVVFGRWFISNPDLVKRIKKGLPLTPYNRHTFYTPENPEGYIDYPFSEDSKL